MTWDKDGIQPDELMGFNLMSLASIHNEDRHLLFPKRKMWLKTNADAVAAQALLEKYMKEINHRSIAHCSAPSHLFINQYILNFLLKYIYMYICYSKYMYVEHWFMYIIFL